MDIFFWNFLEGVFLEIVEFVIQRGNKIVKNYLMAAFILMLIVLAGCSYSEPEKSAFPVEVEETNQPQKTEEKTEPEEVNYVVMEGEQGIILINTGFVLGYPKVNFDEYIRYYDSKDINSIRKMGENKVDNIYANTSITVIKNDGRGVEVKINETGEIGWVPVEVVGKIK